MILLLLMKILNSLQLLILDVLSINILHEFNIFTIQLQLYTQDNYHDSLQYSG